LSRDDLLPRRQDPHGTPGGAASQHDEQLGQLDDLGAAAPGDAAVAAGGKATEDEGHDGFQILTTFCCASGTGTFFPPSTTRYDTLNNSHRNGYTSMEVKGVEKWGGKETESACNVLRRGFYGTVAKASDGDSIIGRTGDGQYDHGHGTREGPVEAQRHRGTPAGARGKKRHHRGSPRGGIKRGGNCSTSVPAPDGIFEKMTLVNGMIAAGSLSAELG